MSGRYAWALWLALYTSFSFQGDALRPELLHRLLYEEPNEQLQELGQISDTVGSLERTFLSPAHKQAANKLQQIMEEAGMHTYIDKVANVHGRVVGKRPDAPVLLSGSHYDTVKDAGKFDGMLGILVPIAAVKTLLVQTGVTAGILDEDTLLKAKHISLGTYHSSQLTGLLEGPVEVIAFSEEEGVRFQTTFLGSRALVGNLIGSGVLEAQDRQGISVRKALGMTNDADMHHMLSQMAYKPDQVKGYVEVHMEQGPILEAKGIPLGVVTGIAGQTRQYVMMSGTQGHAGTIPMPMRKDPMAAAAEVISWMERRCGGGSYAEAVEGLAPSDNLVCTTGSITLWPNTFNVVPGSANFTLDIRRKMACEVEQKTAASAVYSDDSLLDQLRTAIKDSQQMVRSFLPASGGCTTADAEGTSGTSRTCSSPDTTGSKADPLKHAAYEPLDLVSGAGHDALALAELTKMAMLFVRCAGGHSHSPLEHVAKADVASAVAALMKFFEVHLLRAGQHVQGLGFREEMKIEL